MSVKEKRPPHVAPQTVGELIAALQEYPEHQAIVVRTGTNADTYAGEPIVRAVIVTPHSNSNGPYVTL